MDSLAILKTATEEIRTLENRYSCQPIHLTAEKNKNRNHLEQIKKKKRKWKAEIEAEVEI